MVMMMAMMMMMIRISLAIETCPPLSLHTINLYILQSVARQHFIILQNKSIAMQSTINLHIIVAKQNSWHCPMRLPSSFAITLLPIHPFLWLLKPNTIHLLSLPLQNHIWPKETVPSTNLMFWLLDQILVTYWIEVLCEFIRWGNSNKATNLLNSWCVNASFSLTCHSCLLLFLSLHIAATDGLF